MHGTDSPGKKTEVHYHSLLQGIFPTQGLNPGSSELQADSLPSEPQGSPCEALRGRLVSPQKRQWPLGKLPKSVLN